MEKKDIIGLIKCHCESDDQGFKAIGYKIASDFKKNGDDQLSEYVIMLLSNTDYFVPQKA